MTCDHWEARWPSSYGHCSRASCLNYRNRCPQHTEQAAYRDQAAACTRDGGEGIHP